MDCKISKELVSYITYHAMNEAKTLPRDVTKQNGKHQMILIPTLGSDYIEIWMDLVHTINGNMTVKYL